MSDTPRTEAEVNRKKCWSDDLITIDANFACQLERELNEANERIKRLEEAGDDVLKLCQKHAPEYWVENLNKYKAWQKAKEDKL